MSQAYWVYILASRSRSLYVGVTNDLQRRMIEHRHGLVPGFTARYRILRLVHCEPFADIRDAIAREKEIKGWRREKKVWLIERDNPAWQDLADDFAPMKNAVRESGRSGKADPSHHSRRREWVRDDRTESRAQPEAGIARVEARPAIG